MLGRSLFLELILILDLQSAIIKPMKIGRNTNGTFSKGNTGRPKGARNLKLSPLRAGRGPSRGLTQTSIFKSVEGRYRNKDMNLLVVVP